MNDLTANDNTVNAQSTQTPFTQALDALEAVLNSTRQAAGKETAALVLHRRLCQDLGRLRREQGLSFGLASEDAVLHFCLNARTGRSTAGLLDQACAQYRQQPDTYDLVLRAFIPEDLRQQVRAQIMEQAYQRNTNATAAEDWSIFLAMQTDVGDGSLSGPPTGLPKLDAMLGGLRGLTFLGADKGVGKTSLVLYLVLAALRARENLAVLAYSLDMSKTRIYQRLLCCESGLDYRTLFSDEALSAENQQVADAASARLAKNILPRLQVVERDFSYEDTPTYNEDTKPVRKGLTFQGMRQACCRLMNASRTSDVLIVIDLFQKMDPHGEIADGAAKDHYRLDLLDQLRKQSCSLGSPHGFPILVTSEIRKVAPSEGLSRDDLKGDGRMASDADVVMLMWPENTAADTGAQIIPTILRIDKGREGVVRGDLTLWFQHACCRFFDAPPEQAEPHAVYVDKKVPSPHRNPTALDPLAE